MRLHLVVNPASGGGRGSRLLPAVTTALAPHDVTVSLTRSLEHADDLTAAAIADHRVVVAMGGDGLVGRVAGAAVAGGGLMAVVPAGRGNDFCRAVGIPTSAAAAATALSSYAEKAVDVGYVDGRAFLGIASLGFDSEVQEKVLTSRLPLGQLIYAYGALAVIAGWHHARFVLTVDGTAREVRGWNVAVANSGRYGGGMRLAPDASVDDGLLDLVTTGVISRARFLRAFPKVFRGTHVHEDAVDVAPCREVTIDADRAFRVFADGDPVADLPCTVTVSPGALRLLLP